MSMVQVVVQARTSSRRLPGKALLPLAGYPTAVLSTLRVCGPNWDTVLATSDDSSDDGLARSAGTFDLKVVRGPLQDVLSRFVIATANLPDDGIVVRLTADNVFPDNSLVAELVEEFVQRQCGFLFTWGPSLDVPYGLSVEVFRVRALREANEHTHAPSDREHVTPWIRRKYGVTIYRPHRIPPGSGRLRCTIDTFDDYVRIESLFERIPDPVRIPWLDLCTRLDRHPATPRFVVPQKLGHDGIHGRLVLGTAQLGGAYGITNTSGAPSPDAATGILRTALHYGVTSIDTARAYGMSERHIGSALAGEPIKGHRSQVPGYRMSSAEAHVVTKLTPLDRVPDDISIKSLVNIVDTSVFRSCRELRCFTIPTLLIHRARDKTRFGGAVWRRLVELQEQGVIKNLGISAATPQEALDALEDTRVRHLQIPFNIVDWRWKEAGVDVAVRRRRDVTIHARSPLLQGILVTENTALWPRIRQVSPDKILLQLKRIAKELQRESVLDLALSYVRSHPWIDGVVAGFETVEQLTEAVRLFTLPELKPETIAWIDGQRDLYPPKLLDPSNWPR